MSAPRFNVSSSPHIFAANTTAGIMRDVCIALLPTAVFGVVRFGIYSAYVLLASIAGAVLTEGIGCALMRRPQSIGDGSAVVSGLLLGLCCPPYVPLWLPFAGGVFAMGIVKLPFGGIGHNFLNPALTARAFLLASWPALMTQWLPADALTSATTVSSATPLAALELGQATGYADLFIGNVYGCIGEVSKVAILVGAAYLLVRRVINLYIPLGFLSGLFVLSWLLGSDGVYAILSGGAMLGAFFMCNDYATSPLSPLGQVLMGVGAGALTALIRSFGAYIEGVTYAILFMNVLTPLIDRFVRPKAFGEAEKRALDARTGGSR
jgi:electron transport complex protein RnfD